MSTKDYLEKDYYKALGVAKTAKPAEIKTAYRKLARKYHPDSNQGDAKAEERFKEISEAYSVLSDEKRRKEYDEARSLFGGGFRVPTGQRPGQGGFGGFDLGDIFSGTGDNASGGLGEAMVASASLLLGITNTLSAAVRMRVDRMPTSSTVPSMSSMMIESPRRNGGSASSIPVPNTSASISFDASARASPPKLRLAMTPAYGIDKVLAT